MARSSSDTRICTHIISSTALSLSYLLSIRHTHTCTDTFSPFTFDSIRFLSHCIFNPLWHLMNRYIENHTKHTRTSFTWAYICVNQMTKKETAHTILIYPIRNVKSSPLQSNTQIRKCSESCMKRTSDANKKLYLMEELWENEKKSEKTRTNWYKMV